MAWKKAPEESPAEFTWEPPSDAVRKVTEAWGEDIKKHYKPAFPTAGEYQQRRIFQSRPNVAMPAPRFLESELTDDKS